MPTSECLVLGSRGSGFAGVRGENGAGVGAAGIPVALCSLTLDQTL